MPKSHTIEIYGDIGFYDWMTDTLLDGAWFSEQLAQVPTDVDLLEVRINTFGGITAEGLTMYNRMRDFARKRRAYNSEFKVETHTDGFAYSAGSVIFLGGDRRVMHNGTQFMIHNAAGGTFGDYREMLAAHDWLKKTSESIIGLYHAETKIKKEELAEMMDATTFFTAEETVKAGFATHLESSDPPAKDTTLYKGVDARPQNYLKYVNSPTYKTVSYERPKPNTSPQGNPNAASSVLAKSLREALA